MDNFTLLVTLNIVLLINVVFTFLVTKTSSEFTVSEWRAASIFMAAGFFLLMLQTLPPLVMIIISNFLIMTGFYFQISAAIVLEFNGRLLNRKILIGTSVFYWISFLFFTYLRFNTSARIIIISLILVFLFGYFLFLSWAGYHKEGKRISDMQEIIILFIVSSLFYLLRAILTATGTGSVKLLLDDNLITSITFTYMIVYNLVYLMGMFNTSLRIKSRVIVDDKEKMGYLFDFLKDTAQYLEIEALYMKIGETLKKSIGMDSAAIYLTEDDGTRLKLVYAFNELDVPLEDVTSLKMGDGIAGAAAERDRVVEVDIDAYPIMSIRKKLKKIGVRYLAGVPLKTAGGVIGAITVVLSGHREKCLMDKDFFYYLGEQMGLVLQNALLYKQVNDLANIDQLTKLYNRRRMIELLDSEIKRYKRNGLVFSVAMADLDNFKVVNDTTGHKCGDELLVLAASTFHSVCRETDVVCRWGGEEFLFLFINTRMDEATVIAERIRSKFENDRCECTGELATTLSVGIAEFSEDLTRDEVIVRADNALYAAKRKGKNRIEVYRS